MPFSETRHKTNNVDITISTKQWNHIYEKWIKRAVESYDDGTTLCKRSPNMPGNFIKGIVQDLAEADLVIADVTGGKPNVYYELGIRHALKIGTIIITQDIKALPSDLNSYYAFEYTYSDSAAEYEELYRKFEKELHEKIKNFGIKGPVSDSPVSDFLGFRSYLLDKKGYEDLENLKWMVSNCRKAMSENFHVCEFLYTAFSEGKEIQLKDWPILDTYPLEALYTHLHLHQWKLLPTEIAEKLANLIQGHRKLMLSVEQHWQVFRITGADDAVDYLGYILHYVCEERKPETEMLWEEFEKAVDDLGLQIVTTDKKGKKRKIASRKFEKHNF